MIDYQLWIHPELSDLFAVRLELGQVTGICPVLRESAARMKLSDLPYDDRPEALRRARESPEQFRLWEHWWPGEWGLPPATTAAIDAPRQSACAPRRGGRPPAPAGGGLSARLARLTSWLRREAHRGR
jgi:hypothetical protein